MTAFDPYALLGVARSASPGSIKAAYRQRVRRAHPDRGGDAVEFIAIVRAFGLLADPESRRLFDQAGIVDEDGVRNHRRDVAVVLADMFDAAVQSAVAAQLPLARVDFIGQMALAVRKSQADAERQSRLAESEIAALGELRQRIRRTDARENLFAERLEAQIKAKTEQHATVRRRLLILETAAVELGNSESDVVLITALEATP
jgi:curved DNA-binding protein CbpA